MTGSIFNKLDELTSIFTDIKENMQKEALAKPKKNFSVLTEVCSSENCSSNGCKASIKNREIELLERISVLELTIIKLKTQLENEKSLKNEISTQTIETKEINSLQTQNINNNLIKNEVILKSENKKYCEEIEKFKNQVNFLEIELTKIKNENETLENENENLKNRILFYVNEIERYKKFENENRILKISMHTLKNEIMDLKGSIRVFCRIRPIFNKQKSAKIISSNEMLKIGDRIKEHSFSFDRVFDMNTEQADVYNECSMIIQSALEGYKICVFAYGQTGSGKTYTMEGPEYDRGIIIRSLNDIFNTINTMETSGWKFDIKVTYVEIYNEEIYDLFGTEHKKIGILHENENTMLTGCNILQIKSPSEAFESFNNASHKRRTGGTECNARSSRSHAVYTIKINMENLAMAQCREGIINLIDLAGSERLSLSKAEGIRLKETQNINKSLSALGDVFNAILKKDFHIPFRNSKLTYLLQNYLSGNSRTIMMVNISPDEDHINETMCSLRFANKVGQCKLGMVKKTVYSHV